MNPESVVLFGNKYGCSSSEMRTNWQILHGACGTVGQRNDWTLMLSSFIIPVLPTSQHLVVSDLSLNSLLGIDVRLFAFSGPMVLFQLWLCAPSAGWTDWARLSCVVQQSWRCVKVCGWDDRFFFFLKLSFLPLFDIDRWRGSVNKCVCVYLYHSDCFHSSGFDCICGNLNFKFKQMTVNKVVYIFLSS